MTKPNHDKGIEPIHNLDYYYDALRVDTQIPVDPMLVFRNKIYNFSPIGPYFWYVLDFSNFSFKDIGGDVKHILGMEKEDVLQMEGGGYAKEFIYEDDLGYSAAYNRFCWDLLSNTSAERRKDLVCTHTVRVENKETGQLKWVLVQYLDCIIGDDNKMYYVLISISDISHLGYNKKLKLTVFDNAIEAKKIYYSHSPSEETPEIKPLVKFTPRQKQIIKLLGQGYLSKQIAEILNISQNTVNNHRSNILKLANVPNSAALLVYANRNGLI